jgi:hypothetical protein
MADLMNMEIAGVNFVFSCRDSVILQEFPPVYQPFLKKAASGNGSLTLHIRLELNGIPDTGEMTKIFDTDQSWSMYRNNHEYFMALNPPVLQRQTVWLARINESFSKTIVYCSGLLRKKTESGIKVISPVLYPLDQLLLIHVLAQNQGALIHAAGMALRGKGYIFAGRSGAGKSTLTRQFIEGKGFDLLSDDRIAVRKIDAKFMAYGTPWPGDAGIADNKGVPLAGIFFISHGDSNRMEPMTPQQALERLMPVTSIPWYHEKIMTRVLCFCEDLISNAPAYELFFKPDTEVVDVFKRFVSP